MPATPILLTATEDLATGGAAELFRGCDFGVDVSLFLNHNAPGGGAEQHRHPYPEVFIVRDGEVTFVVDRTPVTAHAGQVVVVPAGAIHAFLNSGSDTLEMISVHPAAEMQTEWIEQPLADRR